MWKFSEYFNVKDQYQSLFSGVVRYSSIHPLSFKPLMLCSRAKRTYPYMSWSVLPHTLQQSGESTWSKQVPIIIVRLSLDWPEILQRDNFLVVVRLDITHAYMHQYCLMLWTSNIASNLLWLTSHWTTTKKKSVQNVNKHMYNSKKFSIAAKWHFSHKNFSSILIGNTIKILPQKITTFITLGLKRILRWSISPSSWRGLVCVTVCSQIVRLHLFSCCHFWWTVLLYTGLLKFSKFGHGCGNPTQRRSKFSIVGVTIKCIKSSELEYLHNH